ncbi:MAG TPA: Os1348 family NHLP clan protein [bacterium]|jgi:hypothetical protein|nr:Os1348 family NHLP clan protein [bacterium]
MSREGLVKFVSQVMADEGFRTELKANPDATLAQFDLTAEEIAAIKSADPAKLEHAGVDERVTKMSYMPVEMSTSTGIDALASSTTLYQMLRGIFLPKSK